MNVKKQANYSGIIFILFLILLLGSCNILGLLGFREDSPSTFRVEYNGNENITGVPPLDPNKYENGMFVTVLGNISNLVRTGFSFDNWNTDPNGTGIAYSEGNRFVIDSENIMLYAQWTPNEEISDSTYFIVYDGNGYDSGTLAEDSMDYYADSSVTVFGPGDLGLTGHTFLYWTTESDGGGMVYEEGSIFDMPSYDVTLFAQWQVSEVTNISLNLSLDTGVGAGTVLIRDLDTETVFSFDYDGSGGFVSYDLPNELAGSDSLNLEIFLDDDLEGDYDVYFEHGVSRTFMVDTGMDSIDAELLSPQGYVPIDWIVNDSITTALEEGGSALPDKIEVEMIVQNFDFGDVPVSMMGANFYDSSDTLREMDPSVSEFIFTETSEYNYSTTFWYMPEEGIGVAEYDQAFDEIDLVFTMVRTDTFHRVVINEEHDVADEENFLFDNLMEDGQVSLGDKITIIFNGFIGLFYTPFLTSEYQDDTIDSYSTIYSDNTGSTAFKIRWNSMDPYETGSYSYSWASDPVTYITTTTVTEEGPNSPAIGYIASSQAVDIIIEPGGILTFSTNIDADNNGVFVTAIALTERLGTTNYSWSF
jgi:uncharacterized repeat protein (TIGR02543 family)